MANLLRSQTPGGAALRTLLRADEPIVLPGCYDALGARLIELAGFDAVYMTGFGTAASLLGRPDVGLLSFTEMVDNARRIVSATDLPVVADADTGYGNQINVIRTVQEYERAGVAGLHIEDQVSPKRCGHLAGKEVIDADTFTAKIEAAVAARTNPDLVIIARTDARAPLGFDEALDRARRCRDAGADVLFVEALTGVDEIETIARELSDIPLLFNWVEGGRTPPLSYDELARLGFKMIIAPVTTVLAATGAMQAALAELRSEGTPLTVAERHPSFETFTETIGLGEISELEQRYGSKSH